MVASVACDVQPILCLITNGYHRNRIILSRLLAQGVVVNLNDCAKARENKRSEVKAA